MSRKEAQRGEVDRESKQARFALSQMLGEGRSFSGNERNCCFLNPGVSPAARGRFANISAVSGLDYPDDGRAVALVDWDHDGDLDLWVSNRNAPRLRLMRNELSRGNHFLALRLEGNGTTTSRDTIGARVEVVLGEFRGQGPVLKAIDPTKSDPQIAQNAGGHLPLVKTLRAGEGFLAQSSKWLHFGLGSADVVDKVIVHWPGGEVETFTDIDIDHRYRLIQGSGTARDTTQPARETILARSIQELPTPSQVARIPLIELPTMPRSHYVGFDGQQRDLPTNTGRLLLVNLWASWCGPCLAELSEFSQRYNDVQAKGIDILALSVDGLGEDASETAEANAARLVSEAKFPFPVGRATVLLTGNLQELHNLHIQLREELPLPSSFLIDRQGRLAVIYKGPVSVDQLLEDAAHSEGSRLERFARSAPIPGQPIRHPRVERIAVNTDAALRFRLASRLQDAGRHDQAAQQFAEVLKLRPDSFSAHINLGNALRTLGDKETAISHFQQALRIFPGNAMAHYNIANVLQSQGRTEEAIEHYGEALRINPEYVEAHNNLGNTLKMQGKIEEAIEHFRQVVRVMPNQALGRNNLGNALRENGSIEEAIVQYQYALRINPEYTEAHNSLGFALQRQGNTTDAITHFRQALRIEPNQARTHYSLGTALQASGEIPAAVRHYARAMELQPNNPLPLNNLAWIRATHPEVELRDGSQAVELAERCCQLTGFKVAGFLDTLAATYAEAGRFDDAIKWQAKAVELAPAANKAVLRSRLDLYKAGKPYREKTLKQ